jgi:hypothetical protein
MRRVGMKLRRVEVFLIARQIFDALIFGYRRHGIVAEVVCGVCCGRDCTLQKPTSLLSHALLQLRAVVWVFRGRVRQAVALESTTRLGWNLGGRTGEGCTYMLVEHISSLPSTGSLPMPSVSLSPSSSSSTSPHHRHRQASSRPPQQ